MIYVDDYKANFQRFRMSHLCAVPHDTAELNRFAESLKLKSQWFQKDRFGGHYDVSESKRVEAIRFGAIPLKPIELVKLRQTFELASRG